MKYTQLYTGEDQQSHFREITVETETQQILGNYSKLYPVTHLQFRDFEKGALFDWHNAPQPQYIIYLSGQVEIETSKHIKRIFKAGDILFATDLIGKGHITRTLSKGSCVIVKALPSLS